MKLWHGGCAKKIIAVHLLSLMLHMHVQSDCQRDWSWQCGEFQFWFFRSPHGISDRNGNITDFLLVAFSSFHYRNRHCKAHKTEWCLKTFLLIFVEFVCLQSYHFKVRDSNYWVFYHIRSTKKFYANYEQMWNILCIVVLLRTKQAISLLAWLLVEINP